MEQKLQFDQDQMDTIRYWQQQMQDEKMGGVGYEKFVDKYGPVWAAQVERMGKQLNMYTEQQGKKNSTEDHLREAVTANEKSNFWLGDQGNVGQSIKKGLGRGAVSALNFAVDAGREIGDIENYAKITDFVGNKLLPGNPLALERWAEEMKSKAIARKGGFGFYGRAIATPGDADKYFDNGAEFYDIRPWLKQVMPHQGERLGALGTAAEILVQEMAFMGPMAFLRLAKASRHVTHFNNVADKNYGRILEGKGYLKPMSADEAAVIGPKALGTQIKSLRGRYVKPSAERTEKQMAEALSELIGRKVTVRETKALKKLNARYGAKGGDFFEQVKEAGDRSDISWKQSLQKLAATLNPKEARKVQRLIATGTAKGRFLFKGSAGGAYKETELMASTAAIAGGSWIGEKLGQDFVVLGEVSGGLFGPVLFKNVGTAMPDAFNTLRYHFGTSSMENKEDILLAAAFGKTKAQITDLKLAKNRNTREQLLAMAKTLPSPRIPFLYDFATDERRKLNAYRGLARQIEDLPADIQAEISARVERAEELLGKNPDVYASLSAITGITVLETIEQSARAKDSVGKSISINLNPDQLKQVRRKMEAMDGLVSRLENFKNNITENEAEVKNVEYWRELNNRMVNEVQSHIDDLEFVTDVNVKRIAVNLERRLKDLLDENPSAHKLEQKEIDTLETVTKDDYWKDKGVDDLIQVDDDTGQISTLSEDAMSEYNKIKTRLGASVIADDGGNLTLMFNHGHNSERSYRSMLRDHNANLLNTFKNDRWSYKNAYNKIKGPSGQKYSDYSYKVDATDFMDEVHNSIMDNFDEMSGKRGIKQINNYPQFEKRLLPFLVDGRLTGLKELNKAPTRGILDQTILDWGKAKNRFDTGLDDADILAHIDEGRNREQLMIQMARDIEFFDIYDVFRDTKIKPKLALKGMVDARGQMYRMAHKHSVGMGDGPMNGMYEYRIADAIDKAIDKIPGSKELKEAQKQYRKVHEKWFEGLSYTMFGRGLKTKDISKLKKFDQYFTKDPVDAKDLFVKIHTRADGTIDPKAVELLKDNIVWYHMRPESTRKINKKFFDEFHDILGLQRIEKDVDGNLIEGPAMYSKDSYRSYGDMNKEFTAGRNIAQEKGIANIDPLMRMIRTHAARGKVFGENIPLATIERLSQEQNPERFMDMIMNPSAGGGYEHMAEAIVDVIQKSDASDVDKAKSMRSFKVVMWEASRNKFIQTGTELGFDSAAKRFRANQIVDAAAFDDFVKSNDNILKKIYSKKEHDSMKDLNELVQLVAGQVASPSVSGMPKPITIPAMMSRVYGIFRGVISPKYVITELLYQDARFRRGKLLEEIATDPDAARIMADVVIFNRIKNRRVRSEFTKYWTGAGQRFARDWYEDPVKMDVYSENLMNDLWENEEYTWEDD